MRTSAAALVLLLGLSVAACSDTEAEPQSLPPLASATPSVPPVPSPPAEAAAETPDGASAFARYYLALIDDAYRRGDTTALAAASAPGCGGCDSIMQSVRAVIGRGERQVQGAAVVQAVAAPPVQNGDVILLIDFTVPSKTFVDQTGSTVATTAPTARTTAQMRLVRRADAWLVQGYRIVEK